MNRKQFLKITGAAAAAIPLMIQTSCASDSEQSDPHTDGSTGIRVPRYADHLGLQVFGIRDRLVTDPASTLKAVAEIGYREIEFFDPSTLSTLVPIATDLGLTTVATHFMPGYISGKWEMATQIGMTPPDGYTFDNIIEDCFAQGVTNLGVAIMMPEERETLDDYKIFAGQMNKHAEACRAAGIQLYYHNHSFEFEPMAGTTPLDDMLKELDPELVKFEFDVFWATIAGADPLAWIRTLGDRMNMLHMKDLAPDTPIDYTVFEVDQANFRPLGDGIVNFAAILKVCREVGVSTALVDLDHAEGDMMNALRRCYEHIQEVDVPLS